MFVFLSAASLFHSNSYSGFWHVGSSSTIFCASSRASCTSCPSRAMSAILRSNAIAVGFGCAMASSGGNTSVTPVIPMAFGLKFKLSERWNLGVEFSMTKTFSDHIDGADLADLNRIETTFYKNTDWFSRLTVGITYEFGKRCETCHYVD